MENFLQKIIKSKIFFYLFFPLTVILTVIAFLKNNNLTKAKEELEKTKLKSDDLLKEETLLKDLSQNAKEEADSFAKRVEEIKENKPRLLEDVVDENWHKNRK